PAPGCRPPARTAAGIPPGAGAGSNREGPGMVTEVFAIGPALGLLMTVAYRGLSAIVFAPLCALLAAGLSGLPMLPSYTELFMTGVAGFVRAFFPLFLLGAIFGKLMDASGSAAAIAAAMTRALGPRHAIPAVVMAGAVLT